MGNSRIKNSVRNMMCGSFNRFVSIFFPFVVRTIFVQVIGEEYLGLGTLYNSILQVLNLVDLGFSNAIIASLYQPIAEGDKRSVSALLRLYRNIYRVIGVIILVIGLILTPFVQNFFNGAPPQDVNIYFLWLLYLINTVASYILFAHKVSLLNAHQRNDITENIGTIARVVTSLIQIYIVLIWKNIYLYALLNIIFTIIYNCWCACECKKRYPDYVCTGNVIREKREKIVKDIGALTFQKIGNTISVSLDSIIISMALGLTTVAIYGNYFYVISAVAAFVSLVYTGVTASIGNSIVTETLEKNYTDFKTFFFLNTWLIGWCSISFMCLFQDFMIIWMGNEFLFGVSTVLCLVLRFFFEQLRRIALTYKDAIGMWWYDRWRPIVGCAVNLILNILLVQSIGVAGVAISTVISYVLVEMPWETRILFKYYFERSELEYYKEMLVIIITLGISGFVTYMFCQSLMLHGMIAIVVKLCICIILPNVLFCILNYRNPHFVAGRNFIRKIIDIVVRK